MKMLPLKRGRDVAHSFNCTPCIADVHLADTLVYCSVITNGANFYKVPCYSYAFHFLLLWLSDVINDTINIFEADNCCIESLD